MCYRPILIKNPHYGDNPKLHNNFLYDCSHRFIQVPCGHCSQCRSLKQSFWVQRSQLMNLDHVMFFCTLTYDDDSLPVLDVNDRRIKYADYDHFRLFVKRLRKDNVFGRKFSYLCVSEFGSRKHRPHWHCLFVLPKLPEDNEFTFLNLEKQLYKVVHSYWSVNVGTNRKPIYKPLSKLVVSPDGRSTYDFHYVSINKNGFDDVSFYVTKYILKYDKYVSDLYSALKLNLPSDEFKTVWRIVKPKFLVSKGYGKPDSDYKRKYIRQCLDHSSDMPLFYNPFNGFSSPLAPYLKSRFMNLDDWKRFHKYNASYTDSSFVNEYYSPDQVKDLELKFSKMRNRISNTNSFE